MDRMDVDYDEISEALARTPATSMRVQFAHHVHPVWPGAPRGRLDVMFANLQGAAG